MQENLPDFATRFGFRLLMRLTAILLTAYASIWLFKLLALIFYPGN